MAVNDPVVGELGQIAITVSDVARAKAFYGDVLGLRFLFDAGPNLAFLAAGTVRIMLTTPQGADAVGHNSTLYFNVRSVDKAYDALGHRGATLEHGAERVATLSDHELWLAFVRDPDGNLVGLMEERPLA